LTSFERVEKTVNAALEHAAFVLERTVLIAGCRSRIIAHRDVAAPFFAPFPHLLPPGGTPPELEIRVAGLDDDAVRALGLDGIPPSGAVECAAEGSRVLLLQPHAAAVLDRSGGLMWALLDPLRGDASGRAKPLQSLLSIFCADRGIDLLHGGLVSLGGRGALLAGQSGSGKSTVAFAALVEGLDYLGDDCVAIRWPGALVEGHSVFACGCLEHDHLERFPGAWRGATDPTGEKAVLTAAAVAARPLVASTTIRSVVVPRITGGTDVRIVPIAAPAALLALAPSSIVKRAVPAAGALARMTRLVKSVPCFRLEMGAVERIGPAVRALLEEVS
jgi:hypothetical protein